MSIITENPILAIGIVGALIGVLFVIFGIARSLSKRPIRWDADTADSDDTFSDMYDRMNPYSLVNQTSAFIDGNE